MKFWRPGITGKLFIAILATCIVLLISMHWAVRISFERGFIDYIKRGNEQRLTMLGDALSEQYAQHGSWKFLRNNDRFIFQLLKTFERDNDDRSPPGRGMGPMDEPRPGPGPGEMPPDAAPDRPLRARAAIVAIAVPVLICLRTAGARCSGWSIRKGAYWWARASASRQTVPGAALWLTASRLARSLPRRLSA